ncbi:MAG: DUF998 domain-containing protein [Dehalococcoidales bacterium]|nr:DUF998 domain-containing protein [Dehalococcoidales bacterium]
MVKITLIRLLYACGIAAPPTIILIIIISGMITPGYNPVTDSISTLSDQSSLTPGLMSTGFIVFGILMLCFSAGLYLGLEWSIKSAVIGITFALYGLGMVFGGVFQDSPGIAGMSINVEGVMHNVAITTAFFSLLVGMLLFVKRVHKIPSWYWFTRFTLAAIGIGLLLSIVFIVASHVTYSGLVQRVFYIIPMICIELVSIGLLRLSFKLR